MFLVFASGANTYKFFPVPTLETLRKVGHAKRNESLG